MPKKAATPKEPIGDKLDEKPDLPPGVPIITARKMMKADVEDTDTSSADLPLEDKTDEAAMAKKGRIEPLNLDTATEVTAEAPTPEPAKTTPKNVVADSGKATDPVKNEEQTSTAASTTSAEDSNTEPQAAKPAASATAEATPSSDGLDLDDSGQDSKDDLLAAGTTNASNLTPEQIKEKKAHSEQEKAFEKLIADETYFLPINAAEKRRVHQTLLLVLLLVVVLGIAAVAWAQSAGIVSVPGL